MSPKTKILVGILVIGILLIGGWWIWNLSDREKISVLIKQIPIETMSREEINRLPTPDEIDDSKEIFVVYSDQFTVGNLLVYTCSPVCSGRTFVVNRLDYPSDTILKVRGKRNSEYSGYGFSIESSEKIDISDSVSGLCKSAVIENSEKLSKIEYTELGNTGAKIYFTKDDIIPAANQNIKPIIDYEGRYLHYIYRGPEVQQGIAFHRPFIDCIYNLEENKVEKLVAYVYGHVEE